MLDVEVPRDRDGTFEPALVPNILSVDKRPAGVHPQLATRLDQPSPLWSAERLPTTRRHYGALGRPLRCADVVREVVRSHRRPHPRGSSIELDKNLPDRIKVLTQ